MAVVLGCVLPSAGVAQATLEQAAERAASRVARHIIKGVGRGATGLVADLSVGSDPMPNALRASYMTAFSRRIGGVQSIDIVNHDAARAEARWLASEVERIGRLSPSEQNKRYADLERRRQQKGYDFYVLPIDKSDSERVRLEVRVIMTTGYHDTPVTHVDVSRGAVLAEQLSVEFGAGYLVGQRDDVQFMRDGGEIVAQGRNADVTAEVWSVRAELPRVRLEATLANGDSEIAAFDPLLVGDQRDARVRLDGVLAHQGRWCLSGTAGFVNTVETVGLGGRSSPFDFEGTFVTARAGAGVVLGNLVNGIGAAYVYLEEDAEDTTDGFGGDLGMWNQDGSGFEIWARRTSMVWSFDLSLRRDNQTRSFNSDYFPGGGEADLKTTTARLELNYRRLGSVGIGFVASASERKLVDAREGEVASMAIDRTEEFVLARLSWRWQPN